MIYDQIGHQVTRCQTVTPALPELAKRSNLEHALILWAIRKEESKSSIKRRKTTSKGGIGPQQIDWRLLGRKPAVIVRHGDDDRHAVVKLGG